MAEKVRVGLTLLHRDEHPRLPTLFKLYSVRNVRMMKNGNARVILVGAIDSGSIEATATFPDGEVRDPFRVFSPSQKDLQFVWNKLEGDHA